MALFGPIFRTRCLGSYRVLWVLAVVACSDGNEDNRRTIIIEKTVSASDADAKAGEVEDTKKDDSKPTPNPTVVKYKSGEVIKSLDVVKLDSINLVSVKSLGVRRTKANLHQVVLINEDKTETTIKPEQLGFHPNSTISEIKNLGDYGVLLVGSFIPADIAFPANDYYQVQSVAVPALWIQSDGSLATITQIDLGRTDEPSLYASFLHFDKVDRLYVGSEQSLRYIDLKNGTLHRLLDDYNFNSIAMTGNGYVVFAGKPWKQIEQGLYFLKADMTAVPLGVGSNSYYSLRAFGDEILLSSGRLLGIVNDVAKIRSIANFDEYNSLALGSYVLTPGNYQVNVFGRNLSARRASFRDIADPLATAHPKFFGFDDLAMANETDYVEISAADDRLKTVRKNLISADLKDHRVTKLWGARQGFVDERYLLARPTLPEYNDEITMYRLNADDSATPLMGADNLDLDTITNLYKLGSTIYAEIDYSWKTLTISGNMVTAANTDDPLFRSPARETFHDQRFYRLQSMTAGPAVVSFGSADSEVQVHGQLEVPEECYYFNTAEIVNGFQDKPLAMFVPIGDCEFENKLLIVQFASWTDFSWENSTKLAHAFDWDDGDVKVVKTNDNAYLFFQSNYSGERGLLLNADLSLRKNITSIASTLEYSGQTFFDLPFEPIYKSFVSPEFALFAGKDDSNQWRTVVFDTGSKVALPLPALDGATVFFAAMRGSNLLVESLKGPNGDSTLSSINTTTWEGEDEPSAPESVYSLLINL